MKKERERKKKEKKGGPPTARDHCQPPRFRCNAVKRGAKKSLTGKTTRN